MRGCLIIPTFWKMKYWYKSRFYLQSWRAESEDSASLYGYEPSCPISACSFVIADGFCLICRDFRSDCFSPCIIQMNWFDFAVPIPLLHRDTDCGSSWHTYVSARGCRRRFQTLPAQGERELGRAQSMRIEQSDPFALPQRRPSGFGPSINFITYVVMSLSCHSVLG